MNGAAWFEAVAAPFIAESAPRPSEFANAASEMSGSREPGWTAARSAACAGPLGLRRASRLSHSAPNPRSREPSRAPGEARKLRLAAARRREGRALRERRRRASHQ
eukprot:6896485-Pyramimonas_sp.AAC.1